MDIIDYSKLFVLVGHTFIFTEVSMFRNAFVNAMAPPFDILFGYLWTIIVTLKAFSIKHP